APRRRGLTLIELLITMTIIAIISAAVLGTVSAAMEAGRQARTRSTITKIHSLLMEQWESYATRRVDVHPDWIAYANNLPRNARGQMIADMRLLALRELMKLEMPDRWSDVANQDLPATQQARPHVLRSPPAVSQTYFRRYLQISDNVDAETVLQNQQAECLYMTVMFLTGDGEARTLFSAQEIGDTDNDGAPEFLDGWGNPIRWIRWAPGFAPQSALMAGDADQDLDPFDVYRRDAPSIISPFPNQYPGLVRDHIQEMRERNRFVREDNETRLLARRLVPLVFSVGPDGDSGIAIGMVGNLHRAVGLDPYAANPDDGLQLGAPIPGNDAWRDNITNHLNEY
ncbi:MAG TPA: prepilin-type N-terminal cleavage/methylation domain-containing protein, partial [Lacipirellulaceae bacterium]|nr:prepilin-type N-terminal cleavage/methylation domain-containing protein [Lacipirellulaceae bacterium]